MIATDQLPLRRIAAFARRFGEWHITLAMHASVPLGLTPELLHLIRINFVPDAPWIAEADVLLSSLCREVGGDLYEIDSEVREILLDELRSDFRPERASEVACFLLAYTRQHLEAGLPGGEMADFLRTQQLAALAQMNPAEAARSLALALGAGLRARDHAAILQVVNLTSALAAPLIGEDTILLYAAGLGRIYEGDEALGLRFLDANGPRTEAPQIGGITLPPASELIRMVRPAPKRPREQDRREYWFFLSYARMDQDKYLKKFYQNLNDQVRLLSGATTAEVGFFDPTTIAPGDQWPHESEEALQNSAVLVSVLSRSYFTSEYCGKEWEIFRRKKLAYQAQVGPDSVAPPLILPILWVPLDSLTQVPRALSEIQYIHERFPRNYYKEGLQYLMAMSRNFSGQYQKVVRELAILIVNVANQYRAPALPVMPSLSEVPSAFYDPEEAPRPRSNKPRLRGPT
jgi:TIR domain